VIPEPWRRVALEPPHAFEAPAMRGRLRVQPEDFMVEEELGFAPDGAGQHVLLKVKKRNANTEWVARELGKAAQCRPMDVGYAGLKDRRAIAVQWFSVPVGGQSLDAWRELRGLDFEVLEAHAHGRKLPRGALQGNRFRIRVRDLGADPRELTDRLEVIGKRGVPNFFGPQRFGREAANLARVHAAASVPDEPRSRRRPDGFVLSSARSLIFNAALAERVSDGSWERLERGDLANLDGRGSLFTVEASSDELEERCRRLEVHPTGPLWGRGEPAVMGRVLELEKRIAGLCPEVCELLAAAGMRQERRSLRLAVRDLAYEAGSREITLNFRLCRGSFATAVLRELFALDPPESD
jgi:tRNA pseudouridine13 synthase